MDTKKSEPWHTENRQIDRAVDHADMEEVQVIRVEDTLCGIGRFKPAFMQRFANMFVYVPTLSFTLVTSYAYAVYLRSQITTLEKQFAISSTESGLMTAANDIGFMATILLWSHFAKRMHKPRVLALTTLMFGISGLIPIIPHFLMVSQASDMYETTETSSAGAFDNKRLCLANNKTDTGDDPSEISTASARVRSIAYSILFMSFIIQGVSRSPRFPMAQTYMDDNVPKTQTGFYLGIIAGLSTLGPVVGSILGGVFSSIYVTLKETDLETRDPRFIGAWWLGFVVFSSVALIGFGPMMLFPKWMPNGPAAKAQLKDTAHNENRLAIHQFESFATKKSIMARFLSTVVDMFPSLLRVTTNPMFLVLVFCDSIMSLTASGRITFYPKYMQEYFRITTARSNYLLGVTVILPYAFGMFVGGALTNRLKLTMRGCLGVRWLTDGLSAVVAFLALLVMCAPPIIYGLSNPREELSVVMPDVTNMTCGTQCMCEDYDFLPSCGADNRTYYSPCHAGCTTVLENRNFGNCSCIPESPSYEQTLKPGYCEGSCDTVIWYLVLSVAGSICSSLNSVPSNLVLLRSVHDRDRCLMVGLTGLLRSMIGFFLGPIIFGRVVDTTCIQWSLPNNDGSCELYDGDDLRMKIHVFCGSVLLLLIILNGFAVLMSYKLKRFVKIVERERKEFEYEAAKKKNNNKERDDDDIPPSYTNTDSGIKKDYQNTQF